MNGVYHSMDDPESDYHNFSQPSSSHRLPTLNGVQALLDVIEKHKPISTNLSTLDSILRESSTAIALDGGIPRGGVTEIYGAPGSGKTHFAIQLATNVLREDESSRVVWIDTSSELPYPRLRDFLHISQPTANGEVKQTKDDSTSDETASIEERFGYLYVSSFTHLLSVLMHPTRSFISEGTTLLVIDDFSRIVTNGLPQDERTGGIGSGDAKQPLSRDNIISKSVAVRRAAMLSAISSGLARLAASYSVAVVVLNRATSNRKSGSKIATMRSVLGSQQWNENVAARIVLYRMFWPTIDWSLLDREAKRKQRKRERHALRIAEVERTGGKDVQAEGVRFVILNVSLKHCAVRKQILIVLSRIVYMLLTLQGLSKLRMWYFRARLRHLLRIMRRLWATSISKMHWKMRIRVCRCQKTCHPRQYFTRRVKLRNERSGRLRTVKTKMSLIFVRILGLHQQE